jgi:hypothetical protein
MHTRLHACTTALGLTLLSSSGTALAECEPTLCTGLVYELYVRSAGDLRVQTTGNESLLNCTPDQGVFLTLSPAAAANFKDVYALLLAANVAGKEVTIRIVEGSNPCAILYVRMK